MSVVEEEVCLVDRSGRPVGSAPRSRVRGENLLHAGTGVLLRDPSGRIYVHRRSPAKDWCPSHHDAAAGGLLRVGEEPGAAAARELAEELGVAGIPLAPLVTGLHEDETVRCVEHVFEAMYAGEVTHADGEVVWGAWMTLPQLGGLLRDPAWPFVPDTRALLVRLAREGVGDYAETGLAEARP